MKYAYLSALLLIACGGSTEVAATGSGGATSSGTNAASSGTQSSSSAGPSTSSGPSTTASSTSGSGGSSPACSGLMTGPGDYDEMVQSGGTMRAYHVHVPMKYSPAAPTSVVFVFHGFTQTGTGPGGIEDISQMDPVSDAHGFIAVYPQGVGNSWNAGTCCGTAQSTMVDDVKFVSDLIDQLATEYCVDKKRVFASGLSNGGFLSHRLACELNDRIAAIGAVAGTMDIDPCTPARPVPVMHIHGTGDIIVPYDGGGLSGAKSVPDTIAEWVGIDGCTDAMPKNVYMNGDASCDEYQTCKAGVAVRLCTIDQGGHQWPGGMSIGIGKLSMDLDSSEEIAKFFEAHPMP